MKALKFLAFLVGAIIILPACSSDDDEKEPEVDLRKEFVYCPDIQHPHIIDMGEAGKWSCCNVGAINPTDYGNYYAWGETGTKESYTRTTYKHYIDKGNPPYKEIGENIQSSEYDAATESWKSPWKMPTRNQMEALINTCSHEWVSISGVNGYVFTSPAGNSIFLPAGGRYNTKTNDGVNVNGYYWTSTSSPDSQENSYAHFLFFDENSPRMKEGNRVLGNNIRPIQ